MFKLRHQSSKLFNFFTTIILSLLCVLLSSLTKIDFHKLGLPKDKPEFSATGINANLYESGGSLLYSFNAESGIRFPDSDKIALSGILMHAYNAKTNDMAQQLSSKDGWVDTKDSTAFLGESVVITSFDKDPTQIIRVYTKDVTINSVTKKATTSAAIRATQGNSVLTGNGVSVDYEKQFLVIESNVKVIYVTK